MSSCRELDQVYVEDIALISEDLKPFLVLCQKAEKGRTMTITIRSISLRK